MRIVKNRIFISLLSAQEVSDATRGRKILFSMCDMFGKIRSFRFLTGALFRSSTSSLCSLCYDKPRRFRFRSENQETSRLPIQVVGKLFNQSKPKFTILLLFSTRVEGYIRNYCRNEEVQGVNYIVVSVLILIQLV